MMNTRWTWIGAALLLTATGCSSDDDAGGENGGAGGTGGSAGSAGSGGAGGSSAGTGGSAGSSVGGSGGSAGTTSCVDETNPMFGSCVEGFLANCWAPDLSGTCSSENGVTLWQDGSKYDPQGTEPGIYGASDTAPCIGIQIDNGNITATKGSETLLYTVDQATQSATITCPDGSTFQATFDQVTAFNSCVGLNCPE